MRVEIDTVGPDVHFVQGPHVNWVILADGHDVTLIDSGYPRDVHLLLDSLAHLGFGLASVKAGIVTHAHTDHQGGFARLRALGGRFPIFAHHKELPNVRREVLEQVTAKRAGWNLLDPRVARWSVAALKAGGLDDVSIGDPIGVEDRQALDVPGRPQVILAPGHTSGHAALLCDEGRVLVAGDALVSAHPTMRRNRAALPDYFHADPRQNERSATDLRTHGAELVLPGHGHMLRLAEQCV